MKRLFFAAFAILVASGFAGYAETAKAQTYKYNFSAQAWSVDPKYKRMQIDLKSDEKPGTIIIHTRSKYLYLIEPNGKAMRYGIGVGRDGFRWTGVEYVTRKAEWPDWTPPAEMRERDPTVPVFMKGGPDNPLGARALYLGSSIYRIHGTAQPWTIGMNISSGCIRLQNEDVTDLYNRVKVGAKVIVQE
jgi:lipoprotein-anchoring transpeptidase ErfK/SrfK